VSRKNAQQLDSLSSKVDKILELALIRGGEDTVIFYSSVDDLVE